MKHLLPLFFILALALQACDKCENIECAPCPPPDQLVLYFDTTQSGFTSNEIDSTAVIRFDRQNNPTPTDTTYILAEDLEYGTRYSIPLENPGLNLTMSRYDFLILQKDAKFTVPITDISYQNNYPDKNACCNCPGFRVQELRVNDSTVAGNFVRITR